MEPEVDWSWASPPESIELICLMPNYIIILLSDVQIDTTLRVIKERIWIEAAKYPLYNMLHDHTGYVFHYVNDLAISDELRFDDEGIKLREMRPFFGVLRLEKRKLEDAEKILNKVIANLINFDLDEFDTYKCSEINYFRDEMRKKADIKVLERRKYSWEEKLNHRHPLRFSELIPDGLRNIETFFMEVFCDEQEYGMPFKASANTKPSDVLREIFTQSDSYCSILKVCGREEYLLGDRPLLHFRYIQESLTYGKTPLIVVENKSSVFRDTSHASVVSLPNYDTKLQPCTQQVTGNTISSWSIENMYSCSVLTVKNLTPGIKIGVKVGVYYGDKSLCKHENTIKAYKADQNRVVTCIYQLMFDIRVKELPRCAKLCFVVYKDSETVKPLAWVNTTIFDYLGRLHTGTHSFNMWRFSEDIQCCDLLHPLGTVGSRQTGIDCNTEPIIEIEFIRPCENPVMYPDMERVRSTNTDAYSKPFSSRHDFVEVKKLVKLNNIQERDREEVWLWRKVFNEKAPQLLPKVLECANWVSQDDILVINDMLFWWPELSVAAALQLLDYAHADNSVRKHAVRRLAKLSDDDLSLYLLQLVQALKHECYLMCDLAVLLLERAWSNMHIGHFLFWHLRSEMDIPQVSVRFRLMIEAYCRGSQEHIPELRRQVQCLKTMKEINKTIRGCPDIEKAKSILEVQLKKNIDALSNIYNPLYPAVKCTNLVIPKCTVMNSKMRPMKLVYLNADRRSESNVSFIVKMGDDLRQDMLTLQILRFMEKLWKSNEKDFKMSPYGCISMEPRLGMIEVVDQAETIARIHNMDVRAYACFCYDSLLRWIKNCNKDEADYKMATKAFTESCVGYSVATYVMGIADRHSDNIMIKKNGQLFHIDFGHILGNFKKKIGIKRERAPFVMTEDLVLIINEGKTSNRRNTANVTGFIEFQNKCEEAFMQLRKEGTLLMTLCSMMIPANLPELNSQKDLEYLKKTLKLDESDDEALEHFRTQFKSALNVAGWTHLNWRVHYYAKYMNI